MAFLNSFKNSFNKSLSSSFVVQPPQVENPLVSEKKLSIEKSGMSIVPTYQDQPKYGQEKQHSYEYRLSNNVLRKMYERNVIVRAAIDTIINEVVSAKYVIKSISIDEKLSSEKQKDQKQRIKKIENFLRHPNKNRESFRFFLEKVLFDLLLYDAGVIEKVKSSDGKLEELYAVAGDTTRIKIDKFGKLLGYYQVIENSKEEPKFFNKDQLIYMIMNPRSHTPYGFPVLNTLETMVTAFLYGESYNIKYFENNATPRGILELGNVNEAQLDRFREYWRQENLAQPHRVMVVSNPQAADGKPGVKWIPLAMSSKDMELMQYMNWLMKMILMAFGVTPSEVGFTDDLRGAPMTGQVLQSQAFKNKTIYPMMDRIASFITEEIIVAEFDSPDLEFVFEEEKSIQEEMQTAQRDMILINAGIKTVEEVRKERGLQNETSRQSGGLESILAGLQGRKHDEEDNIEETIVVDDNESSEKTNIVELAYDQLKTSILSAIGEESKTNDILQKLNSDNIEIGFKVLKESINKYLKQKEPEIKQKQLQSAFDRLAKEVKFFLITKEIDSILPKI